MNTPTRRQLLKAGLTVTAGSLVPGTRFTSNLGATPIGAAGGRQTFYPGALPSRSDVVMQMGSLNPDDVDRLKAFHATRIEWFYSTDAALVAAMKKVVNHVGLSISVANWRIPHDTGAALDIDGNLAIAPWMRIPHNNVPWNSVFRPDTRASIMNTVKTDLEIGADSMQFDGPELEYGLLRWAGGDFSPEALSAFRSYCQSSSVARDCRDLAADNYDIRNWIKRRGGTASKTDWKEFYNQHASEPVWQVWTSFMKDSSRQFVSSVREYLHSQRRPVPLSINVNNPLPTSDCTFLLDVTDYLFCEIYLLSEPRVLGCFHACAAAWQLPFIPSIVPLSTADTQWAIALAYALGDNPRVPWGVYVPGKDRYLGTAADYGMLFGFVRSNAQYFDGYDEIADVVLVMEENALTYVPIFLMATSCVGLGATFRFAVIRPDGTVTANQQAAAQPQLAVSVNGSPSNAKTLFPSIPSLTARDFKMGGTNPALRRIFRTVTPDPLKIVAVPRYNKRTGSLLIHVVDASKSGQTLSDQHHMDVLVPQVYWQWFQGINSALLIRPNGTPLNRTLSIKRDAETMTVRVPLAGIVGWGILIFQRG